MATELFGDANQQSADRLLERLRGATAGSYDVAGELGRGGMAVVYVGTDRQLQRRVAIKVMDPRLAMTQGMAARFLQEARIAARLQHPNIIVVHDVRHSDEIIYFVMSLIDGVAVDEICRKMQPVPVDQIRWILLQATRALAYAHSEDIVHRDIKPANILLNLKGDVILTDFGIAKALGDTGLTQSGTQIGTPMYMSPEQFSGVPVGSASDQYALGVTAYEMLAGKPPFSGDLYQLIASHGGKAPEPIQNLRPDCPPFLANAIMRMLEKNPADRWPSLEDLQGVFGANMAMDGGTARRKLAETVRALHLENGGSPANPSNAGATTPAATPKPAATLVVTISPPGATIFVAGSLELRSTVSLDTGQSLPGAGVQWTSSDASVLVVDANGVVSGVAPGAAIIRATVNGGYSEATIRVEAAPIARLSMTTPNLTMRVGDVLSPNVTAVDVNGVTRDDVAMVWISRSPSVADLDAPGRIRAITPGLAVIDVTIGNVRRSLDVAVLRRPIATIKLTAPAPTLKLGESTSFTVEAFDDVGQRAEAVPVRWTSSAPSVVHMDSTGRALAIGPGVARISASIDEATDSFEIESLEPPIGSIQLMLADDHIELGDDVTWTMRVKDVNGASRSTSGVRVWSNAPDILAIDDNGQRALAVHIGTAMLYAAPVGCDANDPLTTVVEVHVTDIVVARVEVFPANLDIEVGSVAAINLQALDGRGRQVVDAKATWMLDSPDIAVVEGQGIVRALSLGSGRIVARVTNSDGTFADATVTVRVRQASVARLSVTADRSMMETGETVTLRATTWDAMDVVMKDAVPAWKSTHPAIARVENDGRVYALSPGRVTITAEVDGKSGQLSLLVAPAAVTSLSITPVSDAVVGVTTQLTVEATDRNGQSVTPEVKWHVSPANAATVTNEGALTPKQPGTITVLASLVVPSDDTGILSVKNAIEATTTIEARSPRIASLSFGAQSLKVGVGRTVRADVRAKTESATTAPPTMLVWSSDHPEIVSVNSQGELKAESLGDARITVAGGDMSAVLNVNVVAGALSGLPVRPLAMAGAVVVIAALAWKLWPSGATPEQSALPGMVASTPSPATAAVDANGHAVSASADSLSVPGSTGAAPVASPPVNRAQPVAPTNPPVVVAKPSAQQGTPVTARPSGEAAAATSRANTRANATDGRAVTPPPPTAQTPPPAVAVDTPVTRLPASQSPPATPPAAAIVEVPTTADLRAIADRIVSDVRSGKTRPTPDLRQFFDYGADHKVSVASAPVATAAEQGHVRTQFELALSRYNAAGIPERRVTIVKIEVSKRGGTPDLVSALFGPVVKPGGK